MQSPFTIFFDETGVRGVDLPKSSDAVVVAAKFTALRRWAVAIQDFSERIAEIESAYAEVAAEHSSTSFGPPRDTSGIPDNEASQKG